MSLNERKLIILEAIINDFINAAEPVGSRTLSKKYNLGVSAATIRNEMADLEELGYLKHLHTSSGRIPSDKAYRLYVDSLMKNYKVSSVQKKAIKEKLVNDFIELEKTIQKASSILSDMTKLTAFVVSPKMDKNKLDYIKIMKIDERNILLIITFESGRINNTLLKTKREFETHDFELLSKILTKSYEGKILLELVKIDIFIDAKYDTFPIKDLFDLVVPAFKNIIESMLDVEVYVDGLNNIFDLPEYNDIERAKEFLQMLSKKENIAEVLVKRNDGVVITIGKENTATKMKQCSLVTATYCINGIKVGKVGVIGPTRMNYEKTKAAVELLTENLSDILK